MLVWFLLSIFIVGTSIADCLETRLISKMTHSILRLTAVWNYRMHILYCVIFSLLLHLYNDLAFLSWIFCFFIFFTLYQLLTAHN